MDGTESWKNCFALHSEQERGNVKFNATRNTHNKKKVTHRPVAGKMKIKTSNKAYSKYVAIGTGLKFGRSDMTFGT